MQQQDPARLTGELHIQFGLGRGDEPSLRVWEMEMRRSKSQPMVEQLKKIEIKNHKANGGKLPYQNGNTEGSDENPQKD